ncbi:MAG: cytochrome C [Campylobacterota bacterium]|nr:cytochrome C [Campylobacterota bacterium]
MNNLLKTILTSAMAMAIATTTVSADATKGQKLFTKKLKSACGITGAAMAGKHTQDEWEEIYSAGKIADEIKTICPSVKDKAIKDKYIQHYFDFFKEYGSDSGNVPSC